MFTSVFVLLGFFWGETRGNVLCAYCLRNLCFYFKYWACVQSKKLNNFNTGGLSNNFERPCMPGETAGSSVNKWSLLIITAIFTKSEKQ